MLPLLYMYELDSVRCVYIILIACTHTYVCLKILYYMYFVIYYISYTIHTHCFFADFGFDVVK